MKSHQNQNHNQNHHHYDETDETDEIDPDKLTALKQSLPTSTHAERIRFLKARNSNVKAATAQLQDYLQWRHDISSNVNVNPNSNSHRETSHTLADAWEKASQHAVAFSSTITTKTVTTTKIPRFIYTGNSSSTTSFQTPQTIPIFQILAGTIDLSLSTAEHYALTIALFLEYTFDRTNQQTYCLLLDVRAGEGWANPSPLHCLSVIQSTLKLCQSYFPERLESLILFPVPKVSLYLWKIIRPFLDPHTASKVQILSGPASPTSPPPSQLPQSMLDEDVVHLMELNRFHYGT